MKFFRGSHSTIIINPAHIVFAKGEAWAGSDIEVVLINGVRMRLVGQDADMFRIFIRDLSEEK